MHHQPKNRQLLAGALALVFSFLFATSGFGQGVTTSSISGFVSSADGKPVAGAAVTVLHVPSGTRSVTTTRSGGQFNFAGLRPGGPYTITVDANNYAEQNKTNYYLTVGATISVAFNLGNSSVVKMEPLTVSAGRDTTFDSTVMGTGSSFSAGQVAQISSVRQDLQDVLNTDTRVNLAQSANNDVEYMMSVAGQNPRENLIMVDGVSATDNFGLNSNGYAGLRSPLPLPWVEDVSFKLNDYDVTYSDYLGAVVDATLKSGTNEFHGSAYEMYMGTNFRGPDPVVGVLGAHESLAEHTTGFTFGGPIIKDKLFFFLGYEAFRELSAPPSQNFIADDNATDTATINSILAKAQSLGDLNQGTFVASDHTWEQNAVGKLDWNISDSQKFEFTFRHTAGLNPLYYNYTYSNETSLSGSWYNSYRTDQSYTAKLNSDWSQFLPGLSTEVEATYKRYNGTATLNGTDWAGVTIYNVPGTSLQGASPPYELYLGPSASYQANALHTNEQEEHGYAEYAIGQQTFKFGVQFDKTLWNNTFLPTLLGSYSFTNVQDFLNQTPTGYSLAAPNTGYTLASGVAHAYLDDIQPMIQDTWRPTSDLTFLFGIRMDYPYEPQRPLFNQIFSNAFGFDNRGTINGNYTISPRFGFNYNLPGTYKTQIRGGAGLFLGQSPLVWLENSFSTAGQLTTYSSSSSNSTVPIPGFTFTGPQSLPAGATPGTAAPNIDLAAPNIHWPANWKENLAVDRELPWLGLVFTAELDLSQVQKGIYTSEINEKPATSGPAFMPDGAIRYAGNITPSNIGSTNFPPGYTTSNFFTGVSSLSSATLEIHPTVGAAYELENTDKGGSQEYTLQIARPLRDDWGFSFGYTHTHATEVAGDAGTTAGSNIETDNFLNPGANVASRSVWAVPDKFVLTATKQFHFIPMKNTATTISAQFIAQTGSPYSFTFKGDADGSGYSGASLFYVPDGPNDPKVAWISPAEEANFFYWLSRTPELEKYEGQVAPENAFYSGFQHTVNLHVEQQVPLGTEAVKLTLFADCFNFANLLSKSWGIVSNYGVYEAGAHTVAGTGYNPAGNNGAGQYEYTFNNGTLNTPTEFSDESRWAIQIGARLEF